MQVLTFPIFKYGKWGKDSILAHNTLFVFGWMETTGQLIVPLTNLDTDPCHTKIAQQT